LRTRPKTSFEIAYRVEKDVKVKERMLLLVLNVVYHGKVAFQVAKDIHKSRGWWAFQWLKRYTEEGIEGLKDKPKSGRRSSINEKTEYGIKTILKQGDRGWMDH
jgi:transposase